MLGWIDLDTRLADRKCMGKGFIVTLAVGVLRCRPAGPRARNAGSYGPGNEVHVRGKGAGTRFGKCM